MDLRYPHRLYPPYLASRSGHRLEPSNPAGEGMLSGSRIYGNGRGRGGKLSMGLMPGHHLVPEAQMHKAVRDFRTLHHIDGKGLHLPHGVPLHLIEQAIRHSEGDRGGFVQFLPLIAGAAAPLIGEAVKGLVGGFAKSGGEHLASKLAGNGLRLGLPMPVHHKGERYFHLHGEGFMDLLKRSLHFAKKAITSEPARRVGHFALQTLKEAIMHAITSKLEDLGRRVSGAESWTGAASGGASKRPAPEDATEEDTTGSGYHAMSRTKRPRRGAGSRAARASAAKGAGFGSTVYGGGVVPSVY